MWVDISQDKLEKCYGCFVSKNFKYNVLCRKNKELNKSTFFALSQSFRENQLAKPCTVIHSELEYFCCMKRIFGCCPLI